MQHVQEAFDVAIVGAGLAGATLALSLVQKGFSIALIDKGGIAANAEPSDNVESMDLRVVALTASSMGLLKSLGVWPAIEAGGVSPYTDMHVWDAEGTAEIRFSAQEINEENIGALIESRVIVSVLHQAIQQSAIRVFTNAEISHFSHAGEFAAVSLADGKIINAELLVGADGGNSFIRNSLDIVEHTVDNKQQAIVCNLESSKPHEQVARQRFLSTGPLAFLPMSAVSDTANSIVWSCDTTLAEELMALDDDAFMARLSRDFEYRLGNVERIGARAVFPLVARHAQAYFKERVVLVGDAAHVVHPLAGQGINLGFGDVSVLVDCLASAKKRGVSVASARVLAKYQRQRRGDNLAMIAITQGFKVLFGAKQLPIRWLRNEGLRRVNSLSRLRQAIIARAVKPLN